MHRSPTVEHQSDGVVRQGSGTPPQAQLVRLHHSSAASLTPGAAGRPVKASLDSAALS